MKKTKKIKKKMLTADLGGFASLVALGLFRGPHHQTANRRVFRPLGRAEIYRRISARTADPRREKEKKGVFSRMKIVSSAGGKKTSRVRKMLVGECLGSGWRDGRTYTERFLWQVIFWNINSRDMGRPAASNVISENNGNG
jgi:hypothetical protein